VEIGEEEGFLTTLIEAPEERRLAGLIVPKLRALLYKLSAVEKARTLANRAIAGLQNFVSVLPCSRPDRSERLSSERG